MRIWLDDVRPKPHDFDVWVTTAEAAITALRLGGITVISLDHDLGEESEKTGYDVAKFIEEAAYKGTLNPTEVRIHSANPVGVKRMAVAIERANLYWARRSGTHGD